MFIKVKRALYSASCIYSSHTHTQHTHTHSHYLFPLFVSLSCSPTQSGCLPAWQRGLQQQQQQRLQSNKHTVQDSNKKEEGKAQRKRKKKQKRRIGLGRVASLGGWGRSLWVRVYFCAGLLLLLLLLLLFALFSYCLCLGRRRCC